MSGVTKRCYELGLRIYHTNWSKGVRKGVGVKTPLELDILQNFITCAKEINCFRILFAC